MYRLKVIVLNRIFAILNYTFADKLRRKCNKRPATEHFTLVWAHQQCTAKHCGDVTRVEVFAQCSFGRVWKGPGGSWSCIPTPLLRESHIPLSFHTAIPHPMSNYFWQIHFPGAVKSRIIFSEIPGPKNI